MENDRQNNRKRRRKEKTLYQRKIDTFAYADMTSGEPERTLICNINEKPWVEYVFYYEAKTNTEHVLWERSAS